MVRSTEVDRELATWLSIIMNLQSQTQLHGQVLKELPRNAPALPGSMLQHKAPSAFAAVINSLIADYLAVCEMDLTLSTFQNESGLQGTRLSSAHILKLLNVKPGTCIWEALATQGIHAQNPSGTSIGVEHARLCCTTMEKCFCTRCIKGNVDFCRSSWLGS